MVRRNDREITDLNQIMQVIDHTKILHLGLNDIDYPYIVPLHYGYEYKNDQFIFYMHGAKVGHKVYLIQRNPKASIELETNIELTSGGDIPCKYGSMYSSFMGKGTAAIVEGNEEKKHGLNLLMVHQTGKEFEFNDQMADSVAVIKVLINEYTAKARSE